MLREERQPLLVRSLREHSRVRALSGRAHLSSVSRCSDQRCISCIEGMTHFTRYLPFEFNSRILVDKPQIFKHQNTLLIVREQSQILVRHELSQLKYILLHEPLVMTHRELNLLIFTSRFWGREVNLHV